MGTSTDAYLIYGIPVGEDDGDTIEINGEDVRIDSLILRFAGIEDDPDDVDWDTQSKIEKASPLEIVKHCSDECPMYIVGVKETYQSASRGYPTEIDPELFKGDTDAWNQPLHEFAERFGIECDPKWYLVSYWG